QPEELLQQVGVTGESIAEIEEIVRLLIGRQVQGVEDWFEFPKEPRLTHLFDLAVLQVCDPLHQLVLKLFARVVGRGDERRPRHPKATEKKQCPRSSPSHRSLEELHAFDLLNRNPALVRRFAFSCEAWREGEQCARLGYTPLIGRAGGKMSNSGPQTD